MDHYDLRSPLPVDGAAMASLAWDTSLDRNSSYAYLLWCRDFADTSAVALADQSVVGFVTGYRRPGAPDTLFVWQVAVDERHRGAGLARRLLEQVIGRVSPHALEASITPDNLPSRALFAGVARDRGTVMTEHDLFDATEFPDAHASERLIRIAMVGD
jgi:L-2,4-diaminobutyric acid acetyltransferase